MSKISEQLPAQPLPIPAPVVVDIAALAEWLGYSEKTIRRACADGDMPMPMRWRGRRRWSVSLIQRWVKDGMLSVKDWTLFCQVQEARKNNLGAKSTASPSPDHPQSTSVKSTEVSPLKIKKSG